MSSLATERVLSVHHWNDSLFSFRTTRDPGLRFENGQFVMIGLDVGGKRRARRRLGQREALGGARDVLGARHRDEDLDLAKGESHIDEVD